MATKKRLSLKISLIVGGVVLLGAIGVLAWGIFTQSWFNLVPKQAKEAKPPTYNELFEELQSEESKQLDNSALYEKYNDRYQSVRDEVIASDPSKWTEETIEKASFLLVYSQRTEAHNLTHIVLNRFEVAERFGIKVDIPNGVTKEYREQAKQEADKNAGTFDGRGSEDE